MNQQLSSKYQPESVEDKWYKKWQELKIFHSKPDQREPYTVVIPPPNVTGVLHMGHVLNNTIQDVLVRRAMMSGKNACWVPGVDHASIATEAKVVSMLAEKGMDKHEIGREKFLEYAWEWKEKYGGIIVKQLKKLGIACDWDRIKFTLDDDMYQSVIKVFVDLYNKGYIYKGNRMINYDPVAKTAVSDVEIIHKEVKQKLFHIRYSIESSSKEHIVIATVRPETIMADMAICVHPDDSRYQHLVGKKALVPIINRSIPIIADEYVDKEFGTGCLKITPAHDTNDYELGLKHNLEILDIFDDEAKLNEKAQIFVGKDRHEARKLIVQKLENEDYIEKVEEYLSNVGFSERTNSVIEPRLSMQWFCKMDTMSDKAYQAVVNEDIKLFPNKFNNTYKIWLENIRDWCISRQLWWGHRIPVWYTAEGVYAVAETEDTALQMLREKTQNEALKLSEIWQDEDVLDTWFSAWLWPISVFDGINHPKNKEIQYYYPTSDLVTAPEILFFWVARMIMSGYEYRSEPPFKNVYLTGIIRDKLGRKMSKSLGNSPEPIELMKQYSTDGVRMGILLSSPAGNDLIFDESHCVQGRNFCNKLWNAFRLIKGWEVDDKNVRIDNEYIFDWIEFRLNKTITVVNDNFEKYRLSDALMAIYRFVWDDFCSWYLEAIKPKDKVVSDDTLKKTTGYLHKILQLLHPFVPFITEEMWHDELLKHYKKDILSISLSNLPKAEKRENQSLIFDEVIKIVTEIRNIRNTHQVSTKPNKTNIRQIKIVSTKVSKVITIDTDVTTWGALKPLIEQHPELGNLIAVENINKTTLEHDGAKLLEGNFTLFLRPKKTKSGSGVLNPIKCINNDVIEHSDKIFPNLYYSPSNFEITSKISDLIIKMGKIAEVKPMEDKPENGISFIVNKQEYFMDLEFEIEDSVRCADLREKLEHLQKFLIGIDKKLSNPKFVANAKEEIIERERKKQKDAQEKIQIFTEEIKKIEKTL